MTVTRIEIERLAAKLRADREANIKELEAKLQDCKDCLQVMPKGTIEEQNERRYMQHCRQELEKMINEERAAYNGAYFEAKEKLEAR